MSNEPNDAAGSRKRSWSRWITPPPLPEQDGAYGSFDYGLDTEPEPPAREMAGQVPLGPASVIPLPHHPDHPPATPPAPEGQAYPEPYPPAPPTPPSGGMPFRSGTVRTVPAEPPSYPEWTGAAGTGATPWGAPTAVSNGGPGAVAPASYPPGPPPSAPGVPASGEHNFLGINAGYDQAGAATAYRDVLTGVPESPAAPQPVTGFSPVESGPQPLSATDSVAPPVFDGPAPYTGPAASDLDVAAPTAAVLTDRDSTTDDHSVGAADSDDPDDLADEDWYRRYIEQLDAEAEADAQAASTTASSTAMSGTEQVPEVHRAAATDTDDDDEWFERYASEPLDDGDDAEGDDEADVNGETTAARGGHHARKPSRSSALLESVSDKWDRLDLFPAREVLPQGRLHEPIGVIRKVGAFLGVMLITFALGVAVAISIGLVAAILALVIRAAIG